MRAPTDPGTEARTDLRVGAVVVQLPALANREVWVVVGIADDTVRVVRQERRDPIWQDTDDWLIGVTEFGPGGCWKVIA